MIIEVPLPHFLTTSLLVFVPRIHLVWYLPMMTNDECSMSRRFHDFHELHLNKPHSSRCRSMKLTIFDNIQPVSYWFSGPVHIVSVSELPRLTCLHRLLFTGMRHVHRRCIVRGKCEWWVGKATYVCVCTKGKQMVVYTYYR